MLEVWIYSIVKLLSMSANKKGKFISKEKLNRVNALETPASAEDGEDGEIFQVGVPTTNQKTFNSYILRIYLRTL